MTGFAIRFLIGALGLWLAQAVVAGIFIDSSSTLLMAALLLGIVNAFVRPFVVFLTFPFTLVTFGLFLLVINAAMLGIVAWLLPGMAIAGFGSAVLGALIISLTSWFASWYVGPRGRFEVIVVQHR